MSTNESAAALAYAQLADALRRGVYPEGARLPGERDLAAQVGVSRMTLRQALARLAGEGQLERSAQRGWFVARRMVGEPPSVLQSFTEMAGARGLRPTSRVLSSESRPATPEEAQRLGVAESSKVLEIRRLRGLDDVPVCLDTTVLAGDRAGALADADLTDRSLYEALRTLCGVVVARSSYTVQAHAVEPVPARLLDLPVGAPVLVGSEVTYDADDLPVLCGTTLYRGDAYRFQADLYRPLS
ncbi:GntR family transcriptional regulator [Actinopolymorpha rutila]|uniref:GntR family transcriptional regulator n=1 Tax=Actinopolymorpha rutila TaxID=446787 RepID=A0A852Z7F3_9ACTN|nr:GntR family transcriptional regulator [Actinopolymorpha rutila]NYH87548.1 GntR family transcriptional regulator [Actinopolymorpha rutila]